MLEGQYWEVLRYIVPVTVVTGLCCLLAIRWAVEPIQFRNVLFRESERGGLGIWFRHLLRDREDTPSIAGSVFCRGADPYTYFFMSFAMRPPTNYDEFLRHGTGDADTRDSDAALLMTAIFRTQPTTDACFCEARIGPPYRPPCFWPWLCTRRHS